MADFVLAISDVLGDFIAVMDKGEIQARGTSLNLKTKFGKGYKVSIQIEGGSGAKARELVTAMNSQWSLDRKAGNAFVLTIPKDDEEQIPQLAKLLDSKDCFKEWSISLSSLEDVFLELAKESHQRHIAATNRPVKVNAQSETRIAVKSKGHLKVDDIRDKSTIKQQVKAHLKRNLRLQRGIRERTWVANVADECNPRSSGNFHFR